MPWLGLARASTARRGDVAERAGDRHRAGQRAAGQEPAGARARRAQLPNRAHQRNHRIRRRPLHQPQRASRPRHPPAGRGGSERARTQELHDEVGGRDMEDLRNHRIQVTIGAVVTALLLLISPAAAEENKPKPFDWPTNVTVETNPNAVVVDSEVHGSSPGGAGTQASGSGSNCSLQNTTTIGEIRWPGLSAYPAVKVFPFFVVCDGHLQVLVFLEWRPSDGSGPSGTAQSPKEIAMRLRDEIPIPQ